MNMSKEEFADRMALLAKIHSMLTPEEDELFSQILKDLTEQRYNAQIKSDRLQDKLNFIRKAFDD